jgi:hypothetical protein
MTHHEEFEDIIVVGCVHYYSPSGGKTIFYLNKTFKHAFQIIPNSERTDADFYTRCLDFLMILIFTGVRLVRREP